MTSLNNRISYQRWLGVILVALSIASIVLVAVQTSRLSDVTACQADYNEAYTKAIQQRSNAARDERQAQRELLVTILSRPTTVEQRRAAFDKYLKSLDEADRERQSTPIPTRQC